MAVLHLILLNILFLCQCNCQLKWPPGPQSTNNAPTWPVGSQNAPSWPVGAQNTPSWLASSSNTPSWPAQGTQYGNSPSPPGTRSPDYSQPYVPIPGIRPDTNVLFTAQKKDIEQLYGMQPGVAPRIPPMPANFYYPNHYRFCSEYWWIPNCRCFFVWMIFCYPESTNSVCWFWYGCWA